MKKSTSPFSPADFHQINDAVSTDETAYSDGTITNFDMKFHV